MVSAQLKDRGPVKRKIKELDLGPSNKEANDLICEIKKSAQLVENKRKTKWAQLLKTKINKSRPSSLNPKFN
jgi:hypothetical protein